MALSTSAALSKDKNVKPVTMEHRHFAFIASVIRDMANVHNQEHGFIDVREDIAIEFADKLSTTNANFDRKRFIAACLA